MAPSTVDWCEENYVYHSGIAEFWNTMSSMTLLYAGYRGWRNHSTLKGSSIYLVLALVGFGSICFHACLTANTQMLDEIPMIFLVCQLFINVMHVENLVLQILSYLIALCASYIVYNMAFLEGELENFPSSGHHGVVDTVNRIEFYFFQCGIILSGLYIFKQFLQKATKSTSTRKLFYRGSGFFLVGWICWLIDYFMCTHLRSFFNPQFHAWWHMYSAIGIYQLAGLSLIFANRNKRLHHVDWRQTVTSPLFPEIVF